MHKFNGKNGLPRSMWSLAMTMGGEYTHQPSLRGGQKSDEAIHKNYKRAAYTLAEIMVVSAMILVAIAYMTSVLKHKMPDGDKATIRHAYGQVSSIVADLAQHDAFNEKGFANFYPWAELVYSNGENEPVFCRRSDCTTLAKLDIEIAKVQAEMAARVSGAKLLQNEKFYGGTKFASLFKTELNIKKDNIESEVNKVNTVPICYGYNTATRTDVSVTPEGTFNDTYDSNKAKSKMTCFKTYKGITYCLPNNTKDNNCFGGYSDVRYIDKYYMVVKIFVDDNYKNEDGYYLQISPLGKVSILSPSKITYGPENSLKKDPNAAITTTSSCDFTESMVGGKKKYDTSLYDTYKQCRLNNYLLYQNPHKN